jgi:hypothetical protein
MSRLDPRVGSRVIGKTKLHEGKSGTIISINQEPNKKNTFLLRWTRDGATETEDTVFKNAFNVVAPEIPMVNSNSSYLPAHISVARPSVDPMDEEDNLNPLDGTSSEGSSDDEDDNSEGTAEQDEDPSLDHNMCAFDNLIDFVVFYAIICFSVAIL